jgi:hypothetical protein
MATMFGSLLRTELVALVHFLRRVNLCGFDALLCLRISEDILAFVTEQIVAVVALVLVA